MQVFVNPIMKRVGIVIKKPVSNVVKYENIGHGNITERHNINKNKDEKSM